MQLPILFYLCQMLILLPQAKVNKWSINVTEAINATKGSNITIWCKFDIPQEQKKGEIKVYWKTNGSSDCSKNDRDKHAFAYHPNSSCIVPNFRNRTKLIGITNKGNCSLQIFNINEVETKIYVRVTGHNDSYSYINNKVTIHVDDKKSETLSPTDSSLEDATTYSTSSSMTELYLATLVPIIGLLVMAAAGTVFWKIHRRSRAFKREEFGYYANFTRSSPTQPKSEPLCKISNKMLPDPKVIDEPLYVNFQTPANPPDQQVESVDNVYGNVDF